MRKLHLYLLALALISPHRASGQPAATQATGADPAEISKLSQQLESGDWAAVMQAVAQMHQWIATQPQKVSGVLRSSWLKSLIILRRNDDVMALSEQAIIALPADTTAVEQFQSMRVRAALAEGRSADALAAAKQLYAVSTIKGATEAIRTICECLDAAYPDDRQILQRFRREQMGGAAAPAAAPSGATTRPALLLEDVKIDPSPFALALAAPVTEDVRSLTGRGNLLILAGRPQEAWELFERAYTLATDKDLPVASESLARCMKAMDGTVGRANAWVLSIRPPTSLAQDHHLTSAFAATQASAKE